MVDLGYTALLEMFHLLNLPTEMIVMIFSLLTNQDIKNLCLVCSYLKQICESSSSLMNYMTLRIRIDHEQDMEHLRNITSRLSLCTSLTIKKKVTISSHDWQYVRNIKTLTHCCLHDVNLLQLNSGEFASFVAQLVELGWKT